MNNALMPPRGFIDTEFEQRCKQLQQRMQQRDIACTLLSSEAEIYYFTGFFTQFWQSPTRPWFVLIPVDGKPTAIIPSIGECLMQHCYVDSIHTWSSPDRYDDGVSLLLQQLKNHTNGGAFGIMMGNETYPRMPLKTLQSIQQAFPNHLDITADIHAIRQIKSSAEIAKIQRVCQLTSQTFSDLEHFCHAGQLLTDTFSQFKIHALKHGVDNVNYLVGAAEPHGYQDIIAPPLAKPLKAFDLLMLDTGCIWDGYFSDFNRNFAIGDASDPVHQTYDSLFEATEQAIKIATQGTTMQTLFQTMYAVLNPNDSATQGVGRYGHGLGIQLTETPSIIDWDVTPLKAGMVITLEPSMAYWEPHSRTQKMMVTEENLLITESAPLLLSQRAPPSLPIL